MVNIMRNYILFLFLILCSTAFPGELVLNGKELGGIRAIAEHVRDGKIDRVKIVKDKKGRYKLEIVYNSTWYSFCFELGSDRGIEHIIRNGIESVTKLLKGETIRGAKELVSFNKYKLIGQIEAISKYKGSSYEIGYFTERLSVEDFTSWRELS
jgi:hypothetical protein